MTITPLRDLVLVELEDAPASSGAIQVVRLDTQPSMYARVIAVGPECREARAGVRCIVSRLQGIEVDGRVLLPESAVLAYVETQDAKETSV